MEKIISIDIGRSRVGAARLVPQSSTVEPIGAFKRAAGQAEKELLEIFKKYSITTVVAGLPLNEDGSEGTLCGDVRRFCKRLLRRYEASLIFVDEYASSAEAQERLGSSFDKGMIDTQSAVIILERYMRDEGVITSVMDKTRIRES